jgi:hypothetical protein
MKSRIRVFSVLIALVMFPVIFTKPAAAQQSYVSFQVFYDQLSPYGQWIDHPNYGYVWIPDAGTDFAPYSSNGYWILTDYGWTWASDYDWGWAPFHYGRWDYDNYYGWFWIPDNEWGPAWVTWRRADGYYGWEPMGPGISIGMSFGNDYNIYNSHWIFVNYKYFGRNDINRYYANQNDHERIFRSSTVINNTYVDNRRQVKYVSGPDRTDVRRVTGKNVSSYTLQENNAPGQQLQKGVFRTYRPDVRNSNGNQKQPSPAKITVMQDVRPPSERNSASQYNKNSGREQQQNSIKQQNAGDKQNTVNKQNEADRQNSVKQQNTLKQQNAIKQQEVVKQQNAIKQQEVVKQQNTRKQQEVVKQQNTVKQQEVVKQQNTRKQQETVKQQNTVKQQEVVKQQNTRKQQNTTKQKDVKTKSNSKKVEPGNSVKSSKEIKTGQSDKTKQ